MKADFKAIAMALGLHFMMRSLNNALARRLQQPG
jgi:hypothetical protein